MTDTPYGRGDTAWFVKDRFGMFIHWGLYAQAARHEWVKNRERITDEDYQKYFDTFHPDLYNPKEWARLAKQAGMKYFVITTKHHEGFCLWDSDYTDYKATNTSIGKDLLREMVDAFRAEGLKVGFYYSLIDWHHPEFPVDNHHPQRDDQAFREATKGRDVKIYAEYMRDQVRELLTKFGKIDILWFDFSYPGEDGKGKDDWESEKLITMIRELQPDIMVDNRLDLVGCGDFVTPEQFQPKEGPKNPDGTPAVWEACQTLSGSWGYHRDEMTWKTVEQVLGMLIDGVSKGGNMLMNVGPTGRGEIDYRARRCLEGIGQWMRYNGRSIYNCGAAPEGMEAPVDCRYTYNPETRRLYLHVFAWPFRTIHLKGMAGKVTYAQFLHDASEVRFRVDKPREHNALAEQTAAGDLVLLLPVVKPNIDIPTIELFLK
ncbi:MAG: alpha-L-fucosidase [Lentisphaeria bacterium]|nr:alpha-L-fucosidase [Lentisphaeria bacterium]